MMKYFVAAQLGVSAAVGRVSSRVRSRRGAGLLEYALVALISVMVFGLIWALFNDQISTLIDNIQTGILDTSN
jgi:predicted PurR-regulated permease PerM